MVVAWRTVKWISYLYNPNLKYLQIIYISFTFNILVTFCVALLTSVWGYSQIRSYLFEKHTTTLLTFVGFRVELSYTRKGSGKKDIILRRLWFCPLHYSRIINISFPCCRVSRSCGYLDFLSTFWSIKLYYVAIILTYLILINIFVFCDSHVRTIVI